MTLFAVDWTWDVLARTLAAVAAFGLAGIALLLVGFKLFELVTPKLDVERRLQEGSVAVGIVVGALLLAIALIVTAAMHG